MKKTLTPLFFLLIATLSGCNPPNDPTTTDDEPDDHNFCEDDSDYFVFERSKELKDVVDEFEIGVLGEDDFNLLLNNLKENDSEANKVKTTLKREVDYKILNDFDHENDKKEEYIKEVYRYNNHIMLVGGYEEAIQTYDKVNDEILTSEKSAIFQTFRDGFCPSVSRYYDVYDFGNITDDFVNEYSYSTEDYLAKLNLVDGGFLAKDIRDKKVLFENSKQFDDVVFQATKTANETEISLIGEYAPVGEALGERVEYKIIIKNGLITKVSNFKGTFEIDGVTKVYRTQESLVKEYSAVLSLVEFNGEQIELDEDIEGTQPLIDSIDIFL